jgi:hypothetical protein
MVFALLVGMVAAEGRSRSVGKIAIVGDHPLRLHIQTSASIAPEVQLVPNPDRLVIDLPNTVAGPGFHGFRVGAGEIRGVRTSLFSTSPLVTRVVVDLNSPEWYRVAPDSTGLVITLGNDAARGQPTGDTIGWVSNAARSRSVSMQPRVAVKAPATPRPATPPPATVNGVTVQFASGQMSIHARGASLSEVLYQIQKITGAEIAIPSGTEQERVAGDFGPGAPNQVLAELLNGSQLNFVVIGSNADPNLLRSVVLSRKGANEDPPAIPQTDLSPPAADNTMPENPEPPAAEAPLPQPQQEQPLPQPQQDQPLPANAPPPDNPPQD